MILFQSQQMQPFHFDNGHLLSHHLFYEIGHSLVHASHGRLAQVAAGVFRVRQHLLAEGSGLRLYCADCITVGLTQIRFRLRHQRAAVLFRCRHKRLGSLLRRGLLRVQTGFHRLELLNRFSVQIIHRLSTSKQESPLVRTPLL